MDRTPLTTLPDPGDGFRWEERSSAVALLPQTIGAAAAFTTRLGGLCPAPWDTLNISYAQGHGSQPDWFDLVTENRKIANQFIDANAPWTRVRQVHGTTAVEATHPAAEVLSSGGVNRANPPADALWTASPSRTVAVSAGDCVPVLLVGDGRIAVAHAGWRGALAGVVHAAAAAVAAKQAFIGPGIGPCCCVLDQHPEVTAAFSARFGPTVLRDEHYLDLWEACRLSAIQARVRDVHVARVCASCHSDLFFSHRRDRGQTGRQALIARLP